MQLKDVTQIIADILRERDSIPLTVDRERYLSDPRPFKAGNLLREGSEKRFGSLSRHPLSMRFP